MKTLAMTMVSISLLAGSVQSIAETQSTTSLPAATNAAQTTIVAQTPAEPSVYQKTVKGDFSTIYKNIFTALENNSYFVIFEPNIGKNLSHFATRWGADYNKNNLDSIRSMVFCNGWYANQMSNLDPKMLALCPLHITLYQKQADTTIVFVKPGVIAKGSAAEKIARELEQDVIKTIEAALLQ